MLPLLLALIAMTTPPETPAALRLDDDTVLRSGRWRAWLACPGGELPFLLDVEIRGGAPRAWIVNGSERIAVDVSPRATDEDGATIRLDFPHYDAWITATPSVDGTRLDGLYRKRRGPDAWSEMTFGAASVDAPSSAPAPGEDTTPAVDVSGRWAIDFESADEPAIGMFEQGRDGEVTGTILTATGDYRYLAGAVDGRRLRLSVFDGAHAFLFDAQLAYDGALAGDFWSGAHWHERWTAVRDDDVALPDAFEQTRWTGAVALGDVRFPDLDGVPRALDDPAFAGRARILQVFGSWCPNCHDASDLMAELDRRHRARGLSILGLAFEVSGEHARDAEQVRRYLARHDAEYPVLVAGLADKDAASQALPLLDRVRSYPTTIFLHGDGRVRAVYTGFSGPATGEHHERLRAQFEALVEELLAEED